MSTTRTALARSEVEERNKMVAAEDREIWEGLRWYRDAQKQSLVEINRRRVVEHNQRAHRAISAARADRRSNTDETGRQVIRRWRAPL